MAHFNYNGLSKSSGIYVIFNSHNWRLYIGSAKCFQVRWFQHYKSLIAGRHSNKFLQADFDKCKAILRHDDFLEFYILQDMPESSREERLIIEEKWIKIHFDGGKQCYNLCDRAISKEGSKDKKPRKNPWLTLPHPRQGVPHTVETKRLISEHHKLNPICGTNHPMFGKTHKTESLQLMVATRNARKSGMWGKTQSNKQKNAASRARSKPVIQQSVSGEFIARFENARVAFSKTGVHPSAISGCCNGRRIVAGGFKWSFE